MKNYWVKIVHGLSPKNRQSLFHFLPGLILALLSFAIRYKALLQSPFANGWDGYFYLVQLKSWIEEGAMHSSDYSLIYPLMRLNYWWAGDYVLAFKASAALLAGGVTFALFLLAKRWSGSIYLALLVGSISLFSPHLTYFTAQYPKNLLGVFLFLLFLYFLSSKKSWKPALLFVLNFFGHKLTFGLSAIFGGLMLAMKKIKLRTAVFFAGFVLLFLLIGWLVPGMPGISDLGRFQESFSKMPQFAPWSFINDFGQNGRISSLWLGEIVLASAIFFLSLPFLFKIENKARAWSFVFICFILLFPFLKWSLTGMSYRFFLVYILISPLFLSLLIEKNDAYRQRFILLGIAVVLMVGSTLSYKSYNPQKHDPDFGKYDDLTRKANAFLEDKSPELVIAHNSLAEYFTFTTGIDAMPWLPEYAIGKGGLWRIATDMRASELENYLTEEEQKMIDRLSVKYFVLPEYLWQKVIWTAEKENNTYLLEKIDTWRNPDRTRPEFLMKKKK